MNVMNRTIFTGDNLPIMRGMDSESIDLIYLDPPFNSNRTYSAPIGSEAAGAAFKDSWTLSDVDEAWHGEIADKEPAMYRIIDAAGLSHGAGMKSYLIMMAVRLLEMKRLLKPTGSIYLHCDPTASHYLKTLMDCVFGRDNYRNEIVWQRNDGRGKGSQHNARAWGVNTDTILFYVKSNIVELHPYRDLTTDEIEDKFPREDENGRRYYTGIPIFRSKSMGDRPNLCFEWRGFVNPHPSGWRLSRARLEEEYQKGNVVIRADGKLERRKYLDDYEGAPMDNCWTDIPRLTDGKERTGYPTQKPLALLERIIKASTNPGAMVFDPFCGCATTLVAAEKLGRQWIGIDLSEMAVRLVRARIRRELQEFMAVDMFDFIHRTDIPQRSGTFPHYRTHKHTLYGKQEGVCNGCKTFFPFRNMTVDHVIPRKHGGMDSIENLQLLCQACNSTKGTGTHEQLIVALQEQGIR